MQGRRNERVAELLRQELGSLLLRQVKDPALQALTITDVRVVSDLSVARVYFAAHDDESAAEILGGLERAVPFLRREIGRRLELRRPPELRFARDTVLEEGLRIDAILREISDEEKDS
jgi:ribosome-binding factor A